MPRIILGSVAANTPPLGRNLFSLTVRPTPLARAPWISLIALAFLTLLMHVAASIFAWRRSGKTAVRSPGACHYDRQARGLILEGFPLTHRP